MHTMGGRWGVVLGTYKKTNICNCLKKFANKCNKTDKECHPGNLQPLSVLEWDDGSFGDVGFTRDRDWVKGVL